MAAYSKSFARPELKDGEHCYIEFGGVAMTADVILNGRHLSHHEGGYSTFRVDLTAALEDENLLVEFAHKTRKDAFYLYKAAWSKKPFVHLCGKRYSDRAEEKTQIKVYSNCESVTLTVDGKELETKTGSRVFVFEFPLTGEHRIEAVSGDCCDSMTLRRVSEPNPAHLFRKQAVINWFDAADYDPSCYSIKDTMGALSQNPQTAAILGRMMERMTASRGDVAKEANNNANLQKMMAELSLESLIKQAGDSVPGEMIRSLNAALQKIKK